MSTPLTNRFVAFGFMGAVVATILGAAISPDHPLTAISVFARATAYILLVFATAATATYVGFLVSGRRTNHPRQGNCPSHRGNHSMAAALADVFRPEVMVRVCHLGGTSRRSSAFDRISREDVARQRSGDCPNAARGTVLGSEAGFPVRNQHSGRAHDPRRHLQRRRRPRYSGGPALFRRHCGDRIPHLQLFQDLPALTTRN